MKLMAAPQSQQAPAPGPDPGADPPSYLRAALPETNFGQQPRHIKLLVVLLFPVYGAARLGLKIVERSATGTWSLLKKVGRTCGQVYAVCKHVYLYLAPRIHQNFIVPCIIRPFEACIIRPVTKVVHFVFDTISALVVQLWSLSCQVWSAIASAFTVITGKRDGPGGA